MSNQPLKKGVLSQKHIKFIQAYIVSGNATESAKRAGYSQKNSTQSAQRILGSKTVQAEIAQIRAEVEKETKFDLKRAIEYAEADRQFARENKNPMAAHKCSEMLARLHGLLIDKHHYEIKQEISIQNNLQRANDRVANILREVSPKLIEVDVTNKIKIEGES